MPDDVLWTLTITGWLLTAALLTPERWTQRFLDTRLGSAADTAFGVVSAPFRALVDRISR